MHFIQLHRDQRTSGPIIEKPNTRDSRPATFAPPDPFSFGRVRFVVAAH